MVLKRKSKQEKFKPASGPDMTKSGSLGNTTEPSFTAIKVTSDVFSCLKNV